jgi:DNA-binding transcriptional ArsR family regulator
MDYDDFRTRDLRLTLLKSLSVQPGYRANENILQHEARSVGIDVSRDQVRTQLRYLKEQGAVELREVGFVMVATISLRGKEHVDGLTVLEGINTPSPGA